MRAHAGLASLVLLAWLRGAAAQVADWPVTEGAPGGGRFTPLTQITRENVKELEVVWSYRHGDFWEGAFPLRVNRGGRRISYKTGKELLAEFDAVFTPKVRRAILDQRFETLFGRDQGVMIGSGEVWFDHLCRNSSCSPQGPVRIKVINP